MSTERDNKMKQVSSSSKIRYTNPPDPVNPDPTTLKDQWRYAIRQYSRWYSHAWGTAIFAGLSFFALGWFIKGSNPLPSLSSPSNSNSNSNQSSSDSPNPNKQPPQPQPSSS